jgi:signal transduction histidine kinase
LLEKKEKILLQRIYQERYMARLGELAAGLAHEIRNPMTLLKSATQHFADHYKFEDQDEELKEVILGEINRINDLIEGLLLLGRIESKAFEVIDIAEIVSEAVKLSEKRALEQKTRINLSQMETRYPVMGDISMAWQLVTNLLVNSIEALVENGTIEIRTYRDDDSVILEVEDDGPGFDPGIKEKILDPFFTTKEKGTGLGLAIAHSVATSMGGRLELVDKIGKGACFRAVFPLVD